MPARSGEREKAAGGAAMAGKGKANRWHPAPPPVDETTVLRHFRRKPAWQWLAVAVLIAVCPRLPAQTVAGEDLAPGHMQSGSLLLKMRDGYRVATRMNTDVSMKITGLIARVAVRQEFRNDGSGWVEGVYVFPLPDAAAVDRLRMHIGERYIEGEIREKEQAKREYETAKAEGKKASLVEEQRPNLFTTSVANIGPGEAVTVEIEYLETLKYDAGTFSLRFPVTLTPRYIPGSPLPDRQGSGWSPDTTEVGDASLITPPVVTRSTDHRLALMIDLDTGMPLEIIASRYHPIDVSGDAGRYRVTLGDGDTPMDHDFELLWRPVPDAASRAALFSEIHEGRPHLYLMVVPPNAPGTEARMARDTILVIDTSGSMHGVSIEQAKQALVLALDGLKAGDYFNVIQFNSVTRTLFPGSVPATAATLAHAHDYVDGLVANGGTEMRPALTEALSTRPVENLLRQIIFITDGSVGNEEELFSLIEKDIGAARLFTVGIGSAPNGWFMRKAAEAGRGTFTFVGATHEVSEKMGRLFRQLENPQITDIRIDWPSGAQAAAHPERVPDLYAGEPLIVKARLSGEPRPGARVVVSGNAPSGAWRQELELADDNGSAGVAAVWARARIESLLDGLRRGADAEETRAEVIRTALDHHLVSRYTSLVAIDRTPSRPRGAGLDSEQVPKLLPYGQSHDAIFGFPATATGAALHRLIGAVCLCIGLLFLATRRRQHGFRLFA
ncbi:MAG: marine proteobacterial sortase target protein [Woeseiaceae bacterium]